MSVTAINHAALAQGALVAPSRRAEATGPTGFGEVLAEGVGAANATMIAADDQITELATTQGANLHETMIALDKADIALRLTSKIGQKLVQAYQEISRMQI